ncbi:ribokinase [Defluviitalea raffinosedens]|uniref:Ribokinase n=1 Tax=Defluviitalea raffinosedens TaxID=1450156 RepID=A0A7C8LFA5_9FIRM|nr:ribokinase [Defluviitalea raffinosedens]KAE9628746.1 ribokinase [Defluviitalea raffinosedens]
MKVLNFGSLNYDYVYSLDHILVPGETIASSKMEVFCGGKGLNQSIALARAGVSVFHAGMVGEDGETLLNMCKQNGVNTELIKVVPGKSGHTIIQVDKDGQNCILLYGGSNRCLTKEYVDEVLSHFEKGDLIVLQNEINCLDYIIDKAYEKEMTIVLNPSPFDDALKSCDLSKVSIFLLNEIEGEQITGGKDPEEILRTLQDKFPKAKIVLTLGSNGSVYQDQDCQYRQGIFKVKAVDTTAAGDTFTGYFIASILQEKPVPEALKLAAKASAIAVSREGAVPSIPTLDEVMTCSI